MKKVLSFVLLGGCLLCSSAAFARICFLGDLQCQDGGFKTQNIEETCSNRGFILESQKCTMKNYELACVDTKNFFRDLGCKDKDDSDRIWCDKNKMSWFDSNYYTCSETACDGQCCYQPQCNGDYTYTSDTSCGSGKVVDTSDFCLEADPDNCSQSSVIKYKYCKCDTTNTYKIKASECYDSNGAFAVGPSCTDRDNTTSYSSCSCASGYSKTYTQPVAKTCSEDEDASGSFYSAQLPSASGGGYCYTQVTCTPKVCSTSSGSVNTSSCTASELSSVTCASLGYTSGTADSSTKCSDGSEPYRCPLSGTTDVFCASGL